jgi:Tfp pilus assembly protein PilX
MKLQLCSGAKGYALITSIIVLAVASALVFGFLNQVNTQQKIGYNDGDYSTAFYAAEAGLEKLNSDLSKQFYRTVYPSNSQLATIQGSDYQPGIAGVAFTTYSLSGGQQAHLAAALTAGATSATVDSTAGWPSSGYFMIDAEYLTYSNVTATTFTGLTRGGNGTTAAAHANNARVSRSQVVTIGQGPNAGLNAQVIPFTLQVVARATSGTEAKLNRDVQVALIPVFQFGVFSDSDLSFFAGPNFNFGGRVHTNGNLYLAEGNGNTLTLAQKVTTAADVIRTQLSNGYSTSSNYTGTVNVIQTPNVYRALAQTEGSLVGGLGSYVNSAWKALSLTTYNGNILNSATGAKALTLPFAGPGISPVEIIKRAPAGEDPLSIISESRLYNQASLRILLSDAQVNLPGGVGYPLNSNLYSPTATYVVDATHPPFAAADPNDADYVTATNADETANTALIDGYIKIEMQKSDNTWQDVTMEVLNLGIAAGNDVAVTPNANAILRFERLKPTKASGSTTATDYMPLSLYDPREAVFRDAASAGLRKIGIMGLVELDANNLSRWFNGTIGTNGSNAWNNSGYILYFSDRRGNRNGSGNETGEFGFEDVANPADAANGVPNGTFEAGEDFNGNGTLETYGGNLPVSPYTAYPTNTDLYNTAVNGQSTTLNGESTTINQSGVTSSSPGSGGTLTVASTTNFPSSGSITIGSEIITYSAKTGTTFTVSARGAFGTTAALHSNGSSITGEQILSATNPTTGQTIGMTTTAGWGTSGYLVVGNEFITYSNKTATNVTVQTRGAFGSVAASHSNGSAASNAAKAQKNRVWYFRRALRLINGAAPNLPTPGFTVATENPVYVQGDYNASGSFNGAHSYAAVMGDAVTLLSNSWNDYVSFNFPYDLSNRVASTTWYRMAIAVGKGPAFAQPSGTAQDFGTDGGTHNFLRYIENWGGSTLNYLGSLVSLYFSRQATGTYKCCTVVYSPPTRAYAFDSEFLVPSQLPPGTPRFRDINNLSFRQKVLANQ